MNVVGKFVPDPAARTRFLRLTLYEGKDMTKWETDDNATDKAFEILKESKMPVEVITKLRRLSLTWEGQRQESVLSE